MIFNSTAALLSGAVIVTMLIYACQAEEIQDQRSGSAGQTAKPAIQDEEAEAKEQETEVLVDKPTPPAVKPAPVPTPTNYTMSWEASTDPAIVSYKVFIVPPDRNPRFPGKTDVPVQIKNFPLAALQKNGQKYSAVVSSDEIKAALGAAVANPTTNCFTVVAVNGVGNSAHSPVLCP